MVCVTVNVDIKKFKIITVLCLFDCVQVGFVVVVVVVVVCLFVLHWC